MGDRVLLAAGKADDAATGHGSQTDEYLKKMFIAALRMRGVSRYFFKQ